MSIRSRLARVFRRRPLPPPVAVPRPLAETIDFNHPQVAANPYPNWRALREAGPVHNLPATGGWMVLGYDAVKEALARPDIFSNAPYRDVDAVLLGEDPPKHATARRLVSRHFTSEGLSRLEQNARSAARKLLRPAFDAVSEFAQPISRSVAAELIGFDAATLAELVSAADSAAGQSLPAMLAALDPFAPRAGLYRQIGRDGEGLVGDAEVRSLIRLLWLASTATTERVIACGVLRLVQDPDLQRELADDRSLLASFTEEILRLHPPELVVRRMVTADAALAGIDIPAGALVFLSIGAANRDPATFPAGDALRLNGASKRHIAFGSGIHHCVGAPLARRVAIAAFDELLDRKGVLRGVAGWEASPWLTIITTLAPLRLDIER